MTLRNDVGYRNAVYGAYRSTDPDTESGGGSLAAHYRRHIVPHLPRERSSRVIDLACGAGELVSLLRASGYLNVSGIDRSIEQVRAAEERGVAAIAHADAFECLASAQQKFDAIIAIDFLEHVHNDEALELLRLVCGALRPGGVFVAQTCNAASPMFGRIRYGDITHETAFTRRSISQAFRVAGLAPVAVHGIDPVPHGARSMVRAAAWSIAKVAAKAYVAIETGVTDEIVSQNLIAVGTRES
jgi:2-polyprenyl-3-methyl-5-hydroxy-6-metoxy-1,4-benzoquinol methylase